MKNRSTEGTPIPAPVARRSPLEDAGVASGAMTGIEAGRVSHIRFEQGEAALRFHPGGILRLTLSRRDALQPKPSYAVVGEPETLLPQIEEGPGAGAGSTRLSAGGLTVSIDGESGEIAVSREPGDLRFATAGGAFHITNRVMGLRGPLGAACGVYGLGEKTGFLDRRGRLYEMWNADESTHFPTQDPLYVSIPFFIRADARGAVGVFLDEPARSWFDIGTAVPDAFSIAAETDTLDLYLIVADQVSGVVERYSALTGRMELPPAWAMGFQQSRYSYIPESRVLEVARTMREKEIPCDAVYLDIDYMDGFRVFTWDPVRFPDPERLIRELGALGMRAVTIVDPGVKLDPEYHVYRSGAAGDHFCRRATGEVYEGAVWAGRSAFPDFTRAETRSWWAGLHEALLGRGVAGIWNDMNEPADFTGEFYHRPDFTPPADVVVRPDGRGTRALEHYHNVYGHLECEATLEAFERYRPDERPFVLTRAAYAGTQRYAAVWTGDNHSWWEHLAAMIPMVLNMGLSGLPFAGADVGGFQADATPELYARWMQAAALMPFFRGHSASDTGAHEPWSFGAEVEEIARQAVQLRYRLLPYIYGLFAEAARHGTPIARPLLWHFPTDDRLHNLNDEFMLGDALLAAPILAPGVRARSVYLPAGKWHDFRSGEVISGPVDVVAHAPLDTIPLYVRAPAVIPTAEPALNAEATLAGEVELHLYPGAVANGPRGGVVTPGAGESAEARRHLYHDDGISLAYRSGARSNRTVRVSVTGQAVTCEVRETQAGHPAAPGEYAVVLHDAGHARTATVSVGETLELARGTGEA